MRILVLSNLYPPNVIGGYERLCFEVAAALAGQGHELTVLTSRFGGKLADYPGQTIRRELDLLTGATIYEPFAGGPAERERINAANLAALERTLAAVAPDVVFAWNLFFLDVSLLDHLAQSRFRTVLMLTDNWLLVMRNPAFVAAFFERHVQGDERFIPPAPGPLARLFRKPPLPPRLSAIFGSAFMRDFYAAGGSRFRHRVIHNGVRQAATAPDRAQPLGGTLRLLFAGRLVALKGAHTAVAALPLLDPAALGVARVQLTLLGDAQDAAYRAALEEAIALSPRAADIRCLPPVAEAELPALFAAHDFYLFPSLYEPFSLTLIHALACGIPTIASDIGGNPEIIRDGQTGLLFRKGDARALAAAITRLARDADLRARLSQAGRAMARNFTFERMVAEMAAFLQDAR